MRFIFMLVIRFAEHLFTLVTFNRPLHGVKHVQFTLKEPIRILLFYLVLVCHMLMCFIAGKRTLGVNFDHLLITTEAVIFVLVLCCFTLAILALCKYMLCVKIKDVFVSHFFPIDDKRFTSLSMGLMIQKKTVTQDKSNRQNYIY